MNTWAIHKKTPTDDANAMLHCNVSAHNAILFFSSSRLERAK